MSQPMPKPPGPSDGDYARTREYFDRAVYERLRYAASKHVDVGSIAAGAQATFTVTVPGVKADQQATVLVGVPSAVNANLLIWGYVSADDTVTVVLRNPTGGAIDPADAVYGVRVIP